MKCMRQKANLSNKERAVLDREIKDELIKIIDKYNREYDVAVILIYLQWKRSLRKEVSFFSRFSMR